MSPTNEAGSSAGVEPPSPPPNESQEVSPSNGKLVHLKTRAEILTAHETVDVYITPIPVKASGTILKVFRDGITRKSPFNLQHLRRIVQPQYLPSSVLGQFLPSEFGDDVAFILICHVSQISIHDLRGLLRAHKCSPFRDQKDPQHIIIISAPAYAPTTSVQATEWSERYWPISYKNTNPYGPHPAMVGRAEAELLGETGDGVKDKIELAKLVAGQCEEMGIGERIGCVIVARSQEGLDEEEVVAVVGDTRWCSAATPGMPEADRSGSGNVMAHAVMRAIAMVANKRLRVATNSASNGDCSVLNSQTAYCDGPLTPFESKYYSNDNLTPNGYLCVDLDIYVTHEPCVMCAMAIVHSRFARCIFAKRMPLTGAMTADDDRGLGHGLFWRPAELNWKLMCWEWECDGETDGEVDERLNV